ncbi:hypothetical protein [Ottowia thiooxydans]|uniref:hypothetical protein n=1 Tax=Ottowia thiooxydans TaxID=219182 RepID=UPI00040E5AE8|nr:hypothetical protein [Ottowia thiooxydans]
MKKFKFPLLSALIVVALTTGCAYRTDSNIPSDPSDTSAAVSTGTNAAGSAAQKAAAVKTARNKVQISEDSLPGKKYAEIGLIEVSVKKLTVFHKDPTKDQADEVLKEKAVAIGADAVVNVIYKSGIGFTTWGYMDAEGTGVKFLE